MKIKSIKVIEGKNKWSETKDKLIHMVLDLGEYEQKPSNKIDGFYERIKEYLPSLKSHRCSEGKPGGFLKRIKEGTWMGHIIEHVALELQTLAGYDTGWGRTRSVRDQKGVYNVVFNYEDEECGKMAAREAYNVVKDIINDKDPQIDNIVKKLKPKKQIRESIRRILKEETNTKSNYQKVIDNFKKILPKSYSEKIDEVFKYIKDFIDKEGFQLKVLNNCQASFKGVRTKNFIIICSPESYASLAELVYIIFHEIRHEIQMGKLGKTNPLSGDLENFDELYEMYWEMEMDAHDYGIEWVNKIGDIINLPKEYYKLSPMITKYPTMSHMVRNQIVFINEIIKEYKQKGYDYSDISDLPFVKPHLDKLEDLF